MPMPAVKCLTLSEFLALPELADADTKWELVLGEVRPMPRPSPEHNRIALALGSRLLDYLRAKGITTLFPDTLIVLDETHGTAVAPDLAYFSPSDYAHTRVERALFGVPTLVIEILSPTTRQYDRGEKLELYHRAKVEWVWLIELEPLMIEEFHWSEAGYVLTQVATANKPFAPQLFPELKLDLAQL